jgi:hypothetical protein
MRLIVCLLAFLAWSATASAQTPQLTRQCIGTAANCVPVSSTNPVPVIPGATLLTPLSPMQVGLTVATSTALTIPAGATYAVVCVRAQNVDYTTDGTTVPTASVGMQLLVNQCLALSGATVLSNFRAIQQAATATLDVSYFR